MGISEDEKTELACLERSADNLLKTVASSTGDPSASTLLELEKVAERAAKIAFGSDRGDLLTDQMQNLIRWTDHLNDQRMRRKFTSALKNRPLASPW